MLCLACTDGWPLLFVLPQAQWSLPLLSYMLVEAYRVHVWGVSGWSTGSGHVTACSKHVAPGGPQTWFRMQHSTHAQNQWRALCFSYHFDARLKTQHIFQQDFFNRLFYMQTNCLFRQEFDFTMMFFCFVFLTLSSTVYMLHCKWTIMTHDCYDR